MKPKLPALVIALGTCLACAALAFTGTALAGGSASTKVIIKAESGGFFGYVKSSNPNKCANGRKVTLFKQKGSSPNPKNDQKIGSDIAQPNGNKYMWSTGNTGSRKGFFYAKAGKVSGCHKAISKTVKAQK